MLSSLCVKESLGKKQKCEDSILVKDTGSLIVGAVSDGCSDSINSHFASTLICYLFDRHYKVAELSNFLLGCIISDLREINEMLNLPEKHLLATFIPFIYLKEERQLRIRPTGDCVYFVNGQEYKIEQDNTPDYIGYQITENYANNILYMEKYPELVYENVDSFIVCSDGIDSFSANQLEDTDPKEVYKLLETPTAPNYLQRTYNILKRKKFTNSDDVSIISYVKD